MEVVTVRLNEEHPRFEEIVEAAIKKMLDWELRIWI